MSKSKKMKGAIAILDRLGTKGIWQRENPEDIILKWDYVMKIYDSAYKVIAEKRKYKPKIFTFSDTVILIFESDDIKRDLEYIGMDLANFLVVSLLHGMFFRGCISIGEFYVGDNIVIGKPIDEAAEYHAMSQWIGVSVAPSLYNILYKMKEEEWTDMGSVKPFIKYKIPLKSGIESGYAVNFPACFLSIGNLMAEATKVTLPNSLEEFFGNELEKATGVDVSFKIRNTIDFVQYSQGLISNES